nr:VirB1-like conjugal transfer protein [uncultured bacterium]
MASQTALATPVTDFHALAKKCAPGVPSETLAPIVKVESHFNPYAIGVVGGRLARQPANKEEAVATAKALEAAGHKFSAGIGQVFRGNWAAFGLTAETVFDACGNLRASSGIFESCHTRAKAEFPNEQLALQAAYSCYYSNNFTTGFKPDFEGQPSYVDKVLLSAAELENQAAPAVQPIPFIPAKATPGSASKPVAVPAPKKPVGPEQVVFDPAPAPVAPAQAPTPALPDEPVKLSAEPQAPPAPKPAAVPESPSPYVYAPENSESQDAPSALVY